MVDVLFESFCLKVQVTDVESFSKEVQEQIDTIVDKIVTGIEFDASSIIAHRTSKNWR